LRTNKI